MPVLGGGASVAQSGQRGMNAYSLLQLVARRVPGYDPTEYMSELNDCYEEIWAEVQQIDEMFFADVVTFTTTTTTDTFDLVWDMYSSLGGSIPRLHQVHRIRINQPADTHFNPVEWRDINDPEYLGAQANTQATPKTTPPYLVAPFGEGSIRFAIPLPAGCQIEVFYTFKCLDLQILSAGSVSTTGTTVSGSGTNFTQLVPSNLQQYLPGTPQTESQIDAEIILNGLTYRVNNVENDTTLVLDTAPPNLNGVSYILASVPEMPPGVHRIIATLATRNILTTPAEDERFVAWDARANVQKNSIKNTLISRQRQEAPRKKRFPAGVGGSSRFTGVK